MQELYYSALDIAAIVSGMDLACKAESKVLDSIWKWEKEFLPLEYRNNQRRYILDIRYWMNYFYEKPILDREFPAIEKDFLCQNRELSGEKYISDFSNLDLFFKGVRLRTMYGPGQIYVRIKLRTLLRQYGYQRRSQLLLQHIERCMKFYHLEATLRGGIPCSVKEIDLDRMITFRVVIAKEDSV